MADLWERFSKEQTPQKKEPTAREYDAQRNNHINPAFGGMKVADIKLGDVMTFHKKMRDTPYLANRILALLSSLLSFAERIEWRGQPSDYR